MSFILWSTIELKIYTGPPFIVHDETLIKFMAIGNHWNYSPRDSKFGEENATLSH